MAPLPPTIFDLPTPALLLDLDRLEQNLAAMATRAERLGVTLRPHIKSHKCIEVAQRQRSLGAAGIAVATLFEARTFIDHGFDDVTWAFPVVLSRLDEARQLGERATLRVVIDSIEAIDALEATGFGFHVFLKVDCGNHRAGVHPTSDAALRLPRALSDSKSLIFDGILCHSGHAYAARSFEQRAAVAESERAVMVALGERLREDGIEVRNVSIGSTPAMTAAQDLDGVTEARPGNYCFFDYSQVVIGSCDIRDCALTVMASVVSSYSGHPGHRSAGRAVVDAGALALSKDPGPADAPEAGFGRIFAASGADYDALHPEAHLVYVSQEHGVLSEARPIGERVRILPNHACLTTACFDEVFAVRGEDVVDRFTVHRGR